MKFYGAVGYGVKKQTKPGVFVDDILEVMYYGDINRNRRVLENSGTLNDNIDISNEISIVADSFAYSNFHSIKYVVFMGTKWKVKTVEVSPPRLKLTLGGVYNG